MTHSNRPHQVARCCVQELLVTASAISVGNSCNALQIDANAYLSQRRKVGLVAWHIGKKIETQTHKNPRRDVPRHVGQTLQVVCGVQVQ